MLIIVTYLTLLFGALVLALVLLLSLSKIQLI